jgi:hypothetical protein
MEARWRLNQREKILAGSVGGILGLFVLIYGIRVIIFKPLQEIDKRTAAVREKIAKIQTERRTYFSAEDRLKAITLHTYADSIEQAGAISGELLTKKILEAGLREDEFARLPVGPRQIKGASEIGWNVQGTGSLTNIINLLFLLDRSPWLHRMENLTVLNGDAPGTARVRFRYLTLVIDPAPEVTRTNLLWEFNLESPERHLLSSIVSRDILRPYVKPLPPPPKPGDPPRPPFKPGVPPGLESFRVVSLSEWDGQTEAHIYDTTSQKTKRFRPGDSIAGGTMVMVDYRPLPHPGNSFRQSSSRLVLKIGGEYWAVERGATLAEKHKLELRDLPPELARQP